MSTGGCAAAAGDARLCQSQRLPACVTRLSAGATQKGSTGATAERPNDRLRGEANPGDVVWRLHPAARHSSDIRCQENRLEHSADRHQTSQDQWPLKRMNRTIKEAAVQRYHCDRRDQVETHLADFITAYNCARWSKTLMGLTPYEYACKCWTSPPEPFKLTRSSKCQD